MTEAKKVYPEISIKNNSDEVKTLHMKGTFLKEQGRFPSDTKERIRAIVSDLPQWTRCPEVIHELEAMKKRLLNILRERNTDTVQQRAEMLLEKINKRLDAPQKHLHDLSHKEYLRQLQYFIRPGSQIMHLHSPHPLSTPEGEEYRIFLNVYANRKRAEKDMPQLKENKLLSDELLDATEELYQSGDRRALIQEQRKLGYEPEEMKGSFTFEEYKSLGYTPKKIDGNLNFSELESAEGIVFPKVVTGDVNLDGLEDAYRLVLPKEIGGNLSLNNLGSIEHLILPEKLKGKLYLKGVLRFDFDEPTRMSFDFCDLEMSYDIELDEKECGDGVVCKVFGKKDY